VAAGSSQWNKWEKNTKRKTTRGGRNTKKKRDKNKRAAKVRAAEASTRKWGEMPENMEKEKGESKGDCAIVNRSPANG